MLNSIILDTIYIHSPHSIRTSILQTPSTNLKSFYNPDIYLEATAAQQLHVHGTSKKSLPSPAANLELNYEKNFPPLQKCKLTFFTHEHILPSASPTKPARNTQFDPLSKSASKNRRGRLQLSLPKSRPSSSLSKHRSLHLPPTKLSTPPAANQACSDETQSPSINKPPVTVPPNTPKGVVTFPAQTSISKPAVTVPPYTPMGAVTFTAQKSIKKPATTHSPNISVAAVLSTSNFSKPAVTPLTSKSTDIVIPKLEVTSSTVTMSISTPKPTVSMIQSPSSTCPYYNKVYSYKSGLSRHLHQKHRDKSNLSGKFICNHCHTRYEHTCCIH